MYRARSLRKILRRLCGTNICTSSARFAPSFVRQPNSPECTQMIRNTPKHQFRVQWGGSDAFVAKNSDATSWHELLHLFGLFCKSFVRQPNGPECTQMYKTHQNTSFGSTGMDRVRSLRKIQTRLRGTNFCTSSARFAPSFVRQPIGPEWIQMVQNALKHHFRVQWSVSGTFVAKNAEVTLWHEHLN